MKYLVCAFILILVLAFPKHARALEQVSYTVTITATVGEPKLTIFGYTSPLAQVQLSGIGVAKETSAGNNGYFLFNRVFLPSPTLRWVSPAKLVEAYPELYLLSLDTDQHTSAPLFLPPLPTGPYEITVGPVTLSPTITLEKGSFSPQEQIVAQGQAIPHSQVKIYLANNFESQTGFFVFIRQILKRILFPHQAKAYFIPEYQIEVNETGRFQFNLPAADPAAWRVFASAYFLESQSPKSNTLTFTVFNLLQWFLEKLKTLFQAFWNLIKPFFWWLVVGGQIALIVLLVTILAHPSGAKIFARAT